MLVKLSGETSRQKSDDWWQLLCSRWWYCKYIVCWVILSWVAKNNVHFIASDNYSICIPVLILFLWRFPVNPVSWSWLQHCRYQYSLETDQESFSGYNHEPVSFLVFFFFFLSLYLLLFWLWSSLPGVGYEPYLTTLTSTFPWAALIQEARWWYSDLCMMIQ